VRRYYYIIAICTILTCSSCGFKFKPLDFSENKSQIEIHRYDRIESIYLTTADYSALQQMSTDYPIETRTLIENVLQLGEINDAEINKKFLQLFQDSILQTLISDVESEFADMSDLTEDLNNSFKELRKVLPNIIIPTIYTQIGALDQSIIINDNSIGICLDKYMGANYPLYKKYYTNDQRKLMARNAIVPDCVCFYLVSLYPMHGEFEKTPVDQRDIYIARIQWLVNKSMHNNFFQSSNIDKLEEEMESSNIKVEDLLTSTDYTTLIPR